MTGAGAVQWPWQSTAKDFTLLIHAAQYWHAAFALTEQAEPIVPHYFFTPTSHLLAHASELALKSFVSERRSKTKFNEFLKNNGMHNLNALMCAAIAHGLEIDLREATPVVQYHYAHHKHVFRYGLAGSMITADPKAALPLIAHLIDRCAGGLGVLRGGRSAEKPIFPYAVPAPMVLPATVPLIEAMAASFQKRLDEFRDQKLAVRPGS
ncbi:hypothetical protein [Shinella sp. M27]|uniref:hypothetical protein n=1 Tax=Shinella sp. M27 TaxID=3368614 RepID=UPI003B9F7CEC